MKLPQFAGSLVNIAIATLYSAAIASGFYLWHQRKAGQEVEGVRSAPPVMVLSHSLRGSIEPCGCGANKAGGMAARIDTMAKK